MSTISLNRIRILKTGLANVQYHIDMMQPENRSYFERLAEPGTQLKLKRVRDDENDPFRIDVYSPDNRYLGRVTLGKNETAARLMDAGLKVIAIVNDSLPVHDSDVSFSQGAEPDSDDAGWNEESRIETLYRDCNLPYCIYYEE